MDLATLLNDLEGEDGDLPRGARPIVIPQEATPSFETATPALELPPGATPIQFPSVEDVDTQGQLQSLAEYIRQAENPREEQARLATAVYLREMYGMDPNITLAHYEDVIKEVFGKSLPPETAWQEIRSRWELGQKQTELGMLYYNVLAGNNDPAVWTRIEELEQSMPTYEEQYNSLPVRAVKSMAEFLPLMIEGARIGAQEGLAAGAAGALAATVGGQAPPLAITPEELFTVPGAFVLLYGVGQVHASTVYIGKIEAGFAFQELINDPQLETIPMWAKRTAAAGVGIVNGALETLQISKIPGLNRIVEDVMKKSVRSLIVNRNLSHLALRMAGRAVGNIGEQVLQEEAQESTNIVVGEFLRHLAAAVEGTEYQTDFKEIATRLGAVATESALGFSVLGLPGIAGGVIADVQKRGAGRAALSDTAQQAVQSMGTTMKESGEVTTLSPEEIDARIEEILKTTEGNPNERIRQAQAFAEEVASSEESELMRRAEEERQRRLGAGEITPWEMTKAEFEQARSENEAQLTESDTFLAPKNEELRQRLRAEAPEVSEALIDFTAITLEMRAEATGRGEDYIRGTFGERILEYRTDLPVDEAGNPRKGGTAFFEDGRALIYVTQLSDQTTIIHELGHIFRRQLSIEDQTVIEELFGVENGNWTRNTEEAFAEAWEAKVLKGIETSDPTLQKAFDLFAAWMRKLYNWFTGENIEIHPEVDRVFTQFLTSDPNARVVSDTEFTPIGVEDEEGFAAQTAGATASVAEGVAEAEVSMATPASESNEDVLFQGSAKERNAASIAAARKTIGITANPLEAGYILPDGKLLDFSGGIEGARTLDHRDIRQEGFNPAGLKKKGTAGMYEWMGRGAVRIDAKNGVATSLGVPSKKQIQAIVDAFHYTKKYGKYVALEDKTGRSIATWQGADPSVEELMTFFKRAARQAEQIGTPVLFQTKAYHGTPHRFDRFTLDKIGTGEGHKSFGWGLYFTSETSIAEWYGHVLKKKAISSGEMTLDDVDTLRVTDETPGAVDVSTYRAVREIRTLGMEKEIAQDIAYAVITNALDNEAIARDLRDRANRLLRLRENATSEMHMNTLTRKADALFDLSEAFLREEVTVNLGRRVVEVTLFKGEKEKWVDWYGNVPQGTMWDIGVELNGRLDTYRREFEKQYTDQAWKYFAEAPTEEELKQFVEDGVENDIQKMKDLVRRLQDPELSLTAYMTRTGQGVYQSLSWALGSDRAASMLLKDIGFSGIRYPAGTLSTVPSEGENYVIFDDTKIEIEGEVLWQTKAYHGTNRTVEKFRLEKIGTGEGAQAFGWGLYFSSSESIARWYADKLGAKKNVLFQVPERLRDALELIDWGSGKFSRYLQDRDITGFTSALWDSIVRTERELADYHEALQRIADRAGVYASMSDGELAHHKEMFEKNVIPPAEKFLAAAKLIQDNWQDFVAGPSRYLYAVTLNRGAEDLWMRWDMGLLERVAPEGAQLAEMNKRMEPAKKEIAELERKWRKREMSLADMQDKRAVLEEDLNNIANEYYVSRRLPVLERILEHARETDLALDAPIDLLETQFATIRKRHWALLDQSEKLSNELLMLDYDNNTDPRFAQARKLDQEIEDLDNQMEKTEALLTWARRISPGSHESNPVTGSELYEFLTRALRSREAASKWLDEAGVTGIMYGAGGISGVESDEFNYVIFNEDKIQIDNEVFWQTALKAAEERNLVLHNLNGGGIINAKKFGGLPMPSLAITREGAPATEFGTITLLARQSILDQADVYDRDIYSPRVPRPDWKVSRKKLVELRDAADEYYRGFAPVDWPTQPGYVADLADDQGYVRDPDTLLRRLLRNESFAAMYLDQVKGQRYQAPTGPAIEERFLFEPLVTAMREEHLGKSDLYGDTMIGEGDNAVSVEELALRAYIHWQKGIYDQLAQSAGADSEVAKHQLRSIERIQKSTDSYVLRSKAQEIYKKTYQYVQGIEIMDSDVFTKDMRQVFDSPEYEAWLRELIAPVFAEARVKVGSKFLPYTLENVINAMRKSPVVGGEDNMLTYGPRRAAAMAARQLYTTDEIKAENYRISPKDRHSEFIDIDQAGSKLQDSAFRFYKYNKVPMNIWDSNNDFYMALGEYLKNHPRADSVEALAARLKAHDFDVPQSYLEEFNEYAAGLAGMAVNYLEAKIRGVVRLEDFAAAVVPSDMDAEVKSALSEAGVLVREYSEPAQRWQQVIDTAQQFNDVLWQTEDDSTAKRTPVAPDDMDGLYRANLAAWPEFNEISETVARQFGGYIQSRTDLKAIGRVKDKAKEYGRGTGLEYDYSKVVDVLGKTLIVSNRITISRVVEYLRKSPEIMVARVKDRWTTEGPLGYRDVLINLRMSNGTIVELQVNTPTMVKAKSEIGHPLYEAWRELDARALNGEFTGTQFDEMVRLSQELDGLSRRVYEAVASERLDSASLMASEREILDAFARIMERLEAEDTSISLSEKTMKSLRESFTFLRTYGMSSYSKNSSNILPVSNDRIMHRGGIEQVLYATDDEFSRGLSDHAEIVQEALDEGKWVPDEVLLDYSAEVWAKDEMTRRQKLRKSAIDVERNGETEDDFVEMMAVMSTEEVSEDYYREVWRTKAAGDTTTASHMAYDWAQNLTPEGLALIFKEIKFKWRANELRSLNPIVANMVKGMNSTQVALTEKQFSTVMKQIKSDPISWMQTLMVELGDLDTARLLEERLQNTWENDAVAQAHRKISDLRRESAKLKTNLEDAKHEIELTRKVLRDYENAYRGQTTPYQQQIQELTAQVREERLGRKAAESRLSKVAPAEEYREKLQSVRQKMYRQRKRADKWRAATIEARQNAIKQTRKAIADTKKKLRNQKLARDHIQTLIMSIMHRPSANIAWAFAVEIRNIQNTLDVRSFRRGNYGRIRKRVMEDFPGLSEEELSEIMRQEVGKRSLRDMSLDELEKLYTQISDLRQQGLDAYLAERNAQATQDLEDIHRLVGEAGGNEYVMGEGSRAEEARFRSSPANWMRASFFNISRLAEVLGPTWRKLFFEEVNAARDAELIQVFRRLDEYHSVLKRNGLTQADLGKDVGEWLTLQEAMYLYIAKFNEDNLAAVQVRYTVKQFQLVDGIMGKAKYRNVAEALMDLFSDEDWKRLEEVLIRSENRSPGRVDNYFPIVRDGGGATYGEDLARDVFDSRTGSKKTYAVNGFTKARKHVRGMAQTPVKIQAAEIAITSIKKQEHYIAFELLTKRLHRLLSHSAVRSAIRQNYGQTMFDALEGYINAVANPWAHVEKDPGQRMLQKIRTNMTLAGLAGNLTSLLRQPAGPLLYIGYASPHRLIGAMMEFLNPAQIYRGDDGKLRHRMIDFVYEIDPQARDRGIDPSLKEALELPARGIQGVMRKVTTPLMVGMRWLDAWTVVVGEYAVYQSNVKKLGHDGAARYAQEATLRTQPFAETKDQPAFFRSNSGRFFTMFGSALSQIFQMMVHDVGYDIAHKKFAKASLALAAVVMTGGAMWMVSKKRPPDEPEEWAYVFASQFLEMLPIVGPTVSQAADTVISGRYNPYIGRGFSLTEWAARVPTVASAIESGDATRIAKQGIYLASDVGKLVGLPSVMVTRIAKTFLEENDEGNIDWWQLLGGPPMGGGE